MSSHKEHLMSLPYLPFRQIVDELVDVLGLRKVLVFRLVNARLGQEILDVILARRLIAIRKHIPFPFIYGEVMNKLLLRMVENPRIENNPLVSIIRRIATLWRKTNHEQEPSMKDGVECSLCEAAVNHLGSLRTAVIMASGSIDEAPAMDELNALLIGTVLVGNIESLKALLSNNVNVNIVNKYFGSLLQASAARGSYEMALSLLEHGADVNAVCGDDKLMRRDCYREEDTALGSAARRDHKQVVRLLLDPVYSLDSSCRGYENAVMDAVYAGHTEMVIFLLKRGNRADISRICNEILWAASTSGSIELVQAMLDEGVDVNAVNLGGSRALEYAAYRGHAAIVSLLFERGADLNYVGSMWNAIQAAARQGHQEVVQILLDHGADINTLGIRYRTPLWEAAENQQSSMMRFLFSKGADLAVEEIGDYAFSRAAFQGHEEVVRILAEMGVSVDGDPDDPNPPPILNAIMHEQQRMVKVLLELGAQWVDPMKSAWREKFMDGTYPKAPPLEPFLKE